MKNKLRLVLIIVGLVLAVIIVKAVLFITAKPKVTVDYVAEYNAITFPANYDPNENAATYYQKASDAFVAMPRELGEAGTRWLGDFNDSELAAFQKWSASNSQAFEQFKIGANKPYCWWQRQTTRYGMDELRFHEKYPPGPLVIALLWKTQEDAVEGQTQAAFENILDCYRAGRQQCRTPCLLTEQESGLSLKGRTMSAALVILDRAEFDSADLKSFQDKLKTELDKDTYLPDLQAEKLYLYDVLQRFFVYDDRGTGRLAWSVGKGAIGACGQWNIAEVLRICLIGPTQNQMVEQTDEIFASFDSIKTKTPKQLRSYDRDYFVKIDTACEGNLLWATAMPSLHGIHKHYHQAKANAEAALTIFAILRYKADTGQYPESLDKLVSAGYLQSVPMDPYSDVPLVYKVGEDNFKLYSVGEDFVDDGGVKTLDVSDIIYWPVQRRERPKPPSDAEKETESTQETADSNQPK